MKFALVLIGFAFLFLFGCVDTAMLEGIGEIDIDGLEEEDDIVMDGEAEAEGESDAEEEAEVEEESELGEELEEIVDAVKDDVVEVLEEGILREDILTEDGVKKQDYIRKRMELEDVCLTPEEYGAAEESAPVLSMPFDMDDYYPKYWGIVPFCKLQEQDQRLNGAINFELKEGTKIRAAANGIVEYTEVGDSEGSGEIVVVMTDGFKVEYGGLTNLWVQAGDTITRGDYIADVTIIQGNQYHLHLAVMTTYGAHCPVKYMNQEFKANLKEMYTYAYYSGQEEYPCACNCEFIEW